MSAYFLFSMNGALFFFLSWRRSLIFSRRGVSFLTAGTGSTITHVISHTSDRHSRLAELVSDVIVAG